MTKRRRERDQPKCGPDAVYNPHKRLHLSYGDDDEPEQDTAALEQPPPINYPPAVKATASPPDTQTKSDQKDKVPHINHEENDKSEPAIPKQTPPRDSEKRGKAHKKANAHPGKNESTNQKPALGSLSYQWEENDDNEEEYLSEEDEAMAYLKSVRSERQGMPVVLRAAESRSEDVDYSLGDSRGYYEEDCYIARPILRPEPPKKATVTAMEAYTVALKRRFEATRTRLQDASRANFAEAQTNDTTPVPCPNGGKDKYVECVDLVSSSPPSSAQLRKLSQEDTLSMLQLIRKNYFKRGETLAQNISTWLWALLARLNDVGTMNNDEVFVLRDLGKRALVIQISFNDAAMAAQLEEISRAEAASDSEEAISPQGEVHRTMDASSDGKTDTAGPSVKSLPDPESTLATLDMIVTIVGEFYGQRDLLESRRPWEPEA